MKRVGLPIPRVALVSLAAVILLLWPVTAHAQWVQAEQRLTTNTADQRWPEVSGTKVAYADYRSAHDVGDPNDPETLFDIRVLDLKTMTTRNLTPSHTAYGKPAISGDRVVWVDYGHGSVRGGIYVYDLKTGSKKRLPISSGREPRISGTRVVYESFRGTPGSWRVYVYDLSTGVEKRLNTSAGNANVPDISGTWVAWQDYRNGNHDIYAYDLKAGTERRLTTDTARQSLPRISGNSVVWVDERNGMLNDDIYRYDLAKNLEQRITTDASMQSFPDVSGNRIVWQDERNGDTEIYLFDLVAGIETRITNSTSFEGNASVSGDRIVYDSQRPAIPGSDLYLSQIVHPTISISCSSTVGYGEKANASGSLTSAAGAPVGGRSVTLEISADNVRWISAEMTATAGDGTYALSSSGLARRRYVRVRFAGDVEYAGALSSARLVRPRLAFSEAPASRTYTYVSGSTHAVWGYFKPKHVTGSRQMRIRAYRYEKKSDGTWAYVYHGSFPTGVSNPRGSAFSKYTGHVRLSQRGRWQIRAYHAADTYNARTYSIVRDVTVK